MSAKPIVLVPGKGARRTGGQSVTALTLPGLELIDADRYGVTLDR